MPRHDEAVKPPAVRGGGRGAAPTSRPQSQLDPTGVFDVAALTGLSDTELDQLVERARAGLEGEKGRRIRPLIEAAFSGGDTGVVAGFYGGAQGQYAAEAIKLQQQRRQFGGTRGQRAPRAGARAGQQIRGTTLLTGGGSGAGGSSATLPLSMQLGGSTLLGA